MKLRFFGDSWFWFWNPNQYESSVFRKHCVDGKKHIPIIEWYLTMLGIECVSNAAPGANLRQTTDLIISSSNHKDISYNIVLFSSPYRRDEILELDVTNYETFMRQWDAEIINQLKIIQEWAIKTNQKVILVGAHSTLYKTLFDSLPDRTNLYFFCECAISNLIGNAEPFGQFKVSDFANLVNYKFDKRLVDHIYNDIDKFCTEPTIKALTYPDGVHLNPTSMLFLLDKILAKIENLEGENI